MKKRYNRSFDLGNRRTNNSNCLRNKVYKNQSNLHFKKPESATSVLDQHIYSGALLGHRKEKHFVDPDFSCGWIASPHPNFDIPHKRIIFLTQFWNNSKLCTVNPYQETALATLSVSSSTGKLKISRFARQDKKKKYRKKLPPILIAQMQATRCEAAERSRGYFGLL